MKKLYFIIFFLFSFLVFGESYNIGDRIKLKLSGDITKSEIENALKDYHIDSLVQEKDGTYLVTFTTYKTGEHNINLKDRNIKIDVISTIDSTEDKIYDELLEEKNKYEEKDYPYKWIVVGYLGFVLSSIAVALNIIQKIKDPYNIFKKRIAKSNEENWRENISLELRRYIDSNYSTNFLSGKYTSIDELTEEDIKFLKNLDYLKFSPDKSGDYQEVEKKAIEIVDRLRKEQKKRD